MDIDVSSQNEEGGVGIKNRGEKIFFTYPLMRKLLWSMEPAEKIIDYAKDLFLEKSDKFDIASQNSAEISFLFHGIGATPFDVRYFFQEWKDKKIRRKLLKKVNCNNLSLVITEYDPTFLPRAIKYLEKKGLGEVVSDAQVADSSKFSFSEETFDMVASTGVYHHLEEQYEAGAMKALSEIYRVLKPGGMIVITSEPTNDLGILGKHFLAKFCTMSSQDYLAYVRKVGFRIVKVIKQFGHIGIVALKDNQ